MDFFSFSETAPICEGKWEYFSAVILRSINRYLLLNYINIKFPLSLWTLKMYIHVSIYIKVFTSILNVTYYHVYHFSLSSVQSLSCVWLCMDCSTPGFPVHHQLPELAQTHVHRVSDTIQPISSSVVPFSSCLQSFPASGSFPITQFFSSGEGNGTPLQYSCLEKFHGQRSLVGCSPWGR